jgi:hypothetical protein
VWAGCNMLMRDISEFWKIFYVQNGVPKSREEVLEKWSKTEFVKSTNVEAKGWLLDVLVCVERIRKQEFSLDDVYAFESYLQAKHPLNRNVRAKTQSGQQLQILRDEGLVRFVGRGRYPVRAAAGRYAVPASIHGSPLEADSVCRPKWLSCTEGGFPIRTELGNEIIEFPARQ